MSKAEHPHAPDLSKKVDYGYDVDPSSDSTAANVVRLVGCGKDVLDVGAGPGSISKVLAHLCDCRVDAIEREKPAIDVLRNYANRIFELDLDRPTDLVEIIGRKYDVIVLADVIEHLYDPWGVVRKLGALLRDDGCFVVSIPHIGHNSVIASLIQGNFRYGESGLLDKTHIRFFSPGNLQDLFLNMGFSLEAVKFVVAHPENVELADAWKALPEQTKRVLSANPLGSVYQIVVKAVAAGRVSRAVDINCVPISPPSPLDDGPKLPSVMRALRRRLRRPLSGGPSDSPQR